MKRRCTKCRKKKPLDRFTVRRGGQINSWCKGCTIRATRLGRQNNKQTRERNVAENARRRRELKAEVDALKAETPCTDCGYNWRPWQMHFDHVRGKKLGHVSRMVSGGCRRQVEEEIKKCELVCANCHADRTHRRKQQGAVDQQ